MGTTAATTLCYWCGYRRPLTQIRFPVETGLEKPICASCCKRSYAKQRLTIPRLSDNDCSNNCDIGYHERCNDNDCPCACHEKEPK